MSETATLELPKFRDLVRQRTPPWLQTELGERILYAVGVHCDALGDALVAGIKQRFPGVYSYESLSLLSRERRIARGLGESDQSFADRLTRWLVDHQRRGGPYAMLAQLYYHYQPDSFDIDLVYANGRRFRLDASAVTGGDVDAAITRDQTDWIPDGNLTQWARWWLFFYTDRWASVAPTDAELQDLRLIPHDWNAAHPIGALVLFPSNAELWNWPPGRSWNESGTWNTGGVARFIEVEP